MSWSFYGTGKASAVSAKAETDINRMTCMEPEQTIKGQVLTIIQTALAAFPSSAAVQIEASGSQSTDASVGTHINQLQLKIMPIFGFVE